MRHCVMTYSMNICVQYTLIMHAFSGHMNAVFSAIVHLCLINVNPPSPTMIMYVYSRTACAYSFTYSNNYNIVRNYEEHIDTGSAYKNCLYVNRRNTMIVIA